MLCLLLNFVKVYSIITSMYHTDGTMYVNRENNVPVALNMKYNDFHTKNVYNVTIVHDNRYSECFYNIHNKYNYITYDKGQGSNINQEIMRELHKLEKMHQRIKNIKNIKTIKRVERVEKMENVKCLTTKWGAWSKCSDACVMYRTRLVLRSGIECPQLTEMKICCHVKDDSEDQTRLRHLQGYVRRWMNNNEPDDEEDRKRIRRVFHRLYEPRLVENV